MICLHWNLRVSQFSKQKRGWYTWTFILLKNGKIVLEQYFNGHSDTSNWYWASAGKTITSFLVGMVLMTLTNRSKYVIYIFASTISLHGEFNWCRLIRANDKFALNYLNLENSWNLDLLPVFMHIVMGLIGCLLSYNFSKTQVKPTS